MSAIPALSLAEFTEIAINPALDMLPAVMDSPEARVLLLAIPLQESGLMHRRQLDAEGRPTGPAKSFYMGEQGGGLVHGTRVHPASRGLAEMLYRQRKVRANDAAIWNAIEHDDVLAAGLARLLLFTDPYKLPKLGRVQEALECYRRLWRPGRYRPNTWPTFYERALEFVTGAQA